MAEEDLIFGKNRHMFGGIEPSNMKKFTLERVNNAIRITAQLPDDTMIDGQLLCTVGGAVIRRKTTGYPVDEFDGDFVAKITESGTVTDSEANINTIYYYAAFPFSTQDVYNRGHKNRAKYDYPEATYYFGFDLNMTDPNPSTRVTYPSGVMNAGYTPAKRKLDSATNTRVFDYGDWPSTAGDKFMPKPCVLNADGTVITYLDPNDYYKSADGESTVVSPSTYRMMEWPKIYTHRKVVGDIYKFRCSDKPLGNDWDCWCNYDINDNQIDHFYTAIYVDQNASSTKAPTSFNSEIATGYASSPVYVFNYPKSIGPDWNTEILSDRLLIQDLLIMIAKTTDWRETYLSYPEQVESSRAALEYQGILSSKGLFGCVKSSDASSDTDWSNIRVKVFGMESFFLHPTSNGRLLTGFAIDKDEIKVKYTSGTYDGSSATDYNVTGSGYLTIASLADYMSTIGSYGGYISGMLTDSHGRIPILNAGSKTTYETDQFLYFRASSGDPKYAHVGASGYYDGLFAIDARDGGSDSSTKGAIALSCKPRRKS